MLQVGATLPLNNSRYRDDLFPCHPLHGNPCKVGQIFQHLFTKPDKRLTGTSRRDLHASHVAVIKQVFPTQGTHGIAETEVITSQPLQE